MKNYLQRITDTYQREQWAWRSFQTEQSRISKEVISDENIVLSGAELTSVVLLMKVVTILTLCSCMRKYDEKHEQKKRSIVRPSALCWVKSLKVWNLFPHFWKYLCVIPRPEGQYWKRLCPRSWVPTEAVGRSPWAVLKTSGTISSNTDRPRSVNNFFFLCFRLSYEKTSFRRSSCNLFFSCVFHSLC